ncbi:uncharacterized bromodomain-containing protein 10 [Amia ocellicauda]|uniref:uncharacterized bromodomain-containing protein 10 n=1 Tax=Amia ocellicauda TaxID=2972642 RepID=UPI003464C7EA
MEEAQASAGPADNEPCEEADEGAGRAGERGSPGGCGREIESGDCGGLKTGLDDCVSGSPIPNPAGLTAGVEPGDSAALTDIPAGQTANGDRCTCLKAVANKQTLAKLNPCVPNLAGHDGKVPESPEVRTVSSDDSVGNNANGNAEGTALGTLHNTSDLDTSRTASVQTHAYTDCEVSEKLQLESHDRANLLSGHDGLTDLQIASGRQWSYPFVTDSHASCCHSGPDNNNTQQAKERRVEIIAAQGCMHELTDTLLHKNTDSTTEEHLVPDKVAPNKVLSDDILTLSGTRLIDNDCHHTTGGLSNGTSLEASLEDASNEGSKEGSWTAGQDAADISEDSRSLPEVCTANTSNEQDELTYEVQQGYRILNGFLLEKHKAITAPFMNPVSAAQYADYGSRVPQPMCLRRIEEKFVTRQYETITDFVADFRLMLENCYRFHGVDHWLSKQAQKLEMMLEQKLTLLSRTLREKTTLAKTSKGCYGLEEEKGLPSTSTRRRSVPRNLGALTTGVSESLMVQALRLEEQQRAKEERRQREQERKEAEEANAKEVEEWERSLLAQASPRPMETLWELPAIGHFLCLAQQALNLPEIVYFELERCLLMPRCSVFLSKVMSSLLSHPQRRATLHRRPALTYHSWEAGLRQKVQGWYRDMGQAEDTSAYAQQIGLCPQFFRALGETSPLEERPFHLLPFYQRVWLLKGLCDWVYENQKEVQDAVLSQPIHECRESILGYDGRENAYIHFPHFCGADLRIYCQSPSASPDFPSPAIHVKRLDQEDTAAGGRRVTACDSTLGKDICIKAGADRCRELVKEECSGTWCSDVHKPGFKDSALGCSHGKEEDEGVQVMSSEDQLSGKNGSICSLRPPEEDPEDSSSVQTVKTEHTDVELSLDVKEVKVFPKCVNINSSDPASLAIRRHQNCEGKSPHLERPARPVEMTGFGPPLSPGEVRVLVNEVPTVTQGPCPACDSGAKPDGQPDLHHSCSVPPAPEAVSPEHLAQEGLKEAKAGRIRTKKKKKKKKKVKELGVKEGQSKLGALRRNTAKSLRPDHQKAVATAKKKGKRKKSKSGKKSESKKTTVKKRKAISKLPIEPTFQLVCTNLDELRELINKIEGELKELENARKKSGKWYFRRQAVKELHGTLVRLLNELTPWEPKLVKAFHRNRARLKKDFDDFKKHPDHDSFVREVWTGEEGDGDMGKDNPSVDGIREADSAENQDQARKRDLHMADDTRPSRWIKKENISPEGQKLPPRSSKRRQSGSTDEELALRKRSRGSGSEEQTSPGEQAETCLGDPKPAVAAESPKGSPVPVFQKGTKPIQALLARNVGNKVTLISQPAAADDQTSNKAAVTPQATKALSSGPSSPKSPMQLVYKMPGNSCTPLDLLRKGSSPVKIAVQPMLDQKTGEKIMQQVVILPTNVRIQRQLDQDSQQQKTPGVAVSKSPSSLPYSLSITRPDDVSRIPVQQVAPLTDASGRGNAPPTVTSCFPAGQAPKTEGEATSPTPAMGASVSIAGPVQGPAWAAAANRAMAISSALIPSKPPDSKQELKTVCIRDSQSILVTTRGGNTGVVKVQTSSDQSASGCLPPSPVISFTPQFQAFLVSKSSASSTATPSAGPTSTIATKSPPPAIPLFGGSPFPGLSKVPSAISIPLGVGQTVGTNVSLALSQPKNACLSVQTPVSKCATASRPPAAINPTLPMAPQNIVSVPMSTSSLGKTSMMITQAPLVQYTTKLPTKRTQSEACLGDRPPLQKVILVTPPSSVTSPVPSSTAPTPPSSVHPQRLMFITQASSSVPHPQVGAPKKTTDTATASQPAISTSSQVKDVQIGLNLGQAIVNAATCTLQNIQAVGLLPGLASRLSEEPSTHEKQSSGANPSVKSTGVTLRTCLSATAASGFPAAQSAAINLIGRNLDSSSTDQAGNKVGGSNDGKAVAYSTLKAGHFASSVLIAASQKQCVSTFGSTPMVQTGAATSSFTPNGPALVNALPARASVPSAPVHNPRCPALLPTKPFPVSPVMSPLCLNPPRNVSTPTQVFNTPVPAPRAPAQLAAISPQSEPPVQQKIVINTTTPLAPGTQIVINNTRFIVPPQGLGPGSHVLLISSPGASPAAPLGSFSAAQKTMSSAAGSGPRMVPPTAQPFSTSYKSSEVASVEKAVGRDPLLTGISVPQVSHLMTAASATHQGLPGAPRVTPAMPLAEGRAVSVASVKALGSLMKECAAGIASSTKATLMPTGLASTLAKAQLPSVVHPMGASVSRTQVLPTATVPPIGSAVSRIQSLPVAKVPPIGSNLNRRQAAQIATVPPSNNTVITTPAQPLRAVGLQPVRMPLLFPNPTHVLSKPALPFNAPALLPSVAPRKLMVSPEGAILNAIQSPGSSLLPVSKAVATVVVTPSSSTGRVLPTVLTDNPPPSSAGDVGDSST